MARIKTAASLIRPAEYRTAPPPAKEADPFYLSPAWRALVARLIAQRGRRCEDPDCRKPDRGAGGRIFGDHIKELRDGGAPLDERNVLLRCGSCHSRKTAAERARRMAQRYG